VLDLRSLTRVPDGPSDPAKQVAPSVGQTEQHSPAVAGHIATGEFGLDNAATKAWNRELDRS